MQCLPATIISKQPFSGLLIRRSKYEGSPWENVYNPIIISVVISSCRNYEY